MMMNYGIVYAVALRYGSPSAVQIPWTTAGLRDERITWLKASFDFPLGWGGGKWCFWNGLNLYFSPGRSIVRIPMVQLASFVYHEEPTPFVGRLYRCMCKRDDDTLYPQDNCYSEFPTWTILNTIYRGNLIVLGVFGVSPQSIYWINEVPHCMVPLPPQSHRIILPPW